MFQSTASLDQSLTTLNGEDESNSPERFREAERKSKPRIKMTAKTRIVFHEMAARSLVADHIQPAKRINVTSATDGETRIMPSKPMASHIHPEDAGRVERVLACPSDFCGVALISRSPRGGRPETCHRTNPYNASAPNVIKYGSRIGEAPSRVLSG